MLQIQQIAIIIILNGWVLDHFSLSYILLKFNLYDTFRSAAPNNDATEPE